MKKFLTKVIAFTMILGATMAMSSMPTMANGSTYEWSANGTIPTGDQTLFDNAYGTATAYNTIETVGSTQFKEQKGTTVGKHQYSKKGFSTNSLNTYLAVDSSDTTKTYRIAFKYVAKKNSVLRIDAKVNSGKEIMILKDLNITGTQSNCDLGTANSVYTHTAGSSNELHSFSFYIEEGETVWFAGQGTDIPIYGIDACSVAETAESIGDDSYVVTDSTSKNTYLVHNVTDEEMAANNLALVGKSGNVGKTTTVYKSIQFADDSKIEAANGKYIYAVEITGTNGVEPAVTSFTWATNVE